MCDLSPPRAGAELISVHRTAWSLWPISPQTCWMVWLMWHVFIQKQAWDCPHQFLQQNGPESTQGDSTRPWLWDLLVSKIRQTNFFFFLVIQLLKGNWIPSVWNHRLLNKIGTWGQWKIGTKRDLLTHIVQSPSAWSSCGKELSHCCIKTSWVCCPHKISWKSVLEMHFLDSQVLLISSWNVFLAIL